MAGHLDSVDCAGRNFDNHLVPVLPVLGLGSRKQEGFIPQGLVHVGTTYEVVSGGGDLGLSH